MEVKHLVKHQINFTFRLLTF